MSQTENINNDDGIALNSVSHPEWVADKLEEFIPQCFFSARALEQWEITFSQYNTGI